MQNRLFVIVFKVFRTLWLPLNIFFVFYLSLPCNLQILFVLQFSRLFALRLRNCKYIEKCTKVYSKWKLPLSIYLLKNELRNSFGVIPEADVLAQNIYIFISLSLEKTISVDVVRYTTSHETTVQFRQMLLEALNQERPLSKTTMERRQKTLVRLIQLNSRAEKTSDYKDSKSWQRNPKTSWLVTKTVREDSME